MLPAALERDLERQADRYDALVSRADAEALAALEDARRDVLVALLAAVPADARPERESLSVALLLLARSLSGLSRVEDVARRYARQAWDRGAADTAEVIRRFEPVIDRRVPWPDVLDVATAAALVSYLRQRAEAAMRLAVVRGDTWGNVAQSVAGERRSALAEGRGAVVRSIEETTSVGYNLAAQAEIGAHDASGVGAAAGRLSRMVVEIRDRRNHPISRVLDRQVAGPDEDFVASVASVEAVAKSMRRSAGAVFWPVRDGAYRGRNLPAHPYERGRIIPWRASWAQVSA